MFQFRALRAFTDDESGAVTVDWVVLSAGIIGLSLAMTGLFLSGFQPGAKNLGSEIEEIQLDTTF